jgi:hypothetical protein
MVIEGKGISPHHTLSVSNVCAYSLEGHKLTCVNALGTPFGSTTSHIMDKTQ